MVVDKEVSVLQFEKFLFAGGIYPSSEQLVNLALTYLLCSFIVENFRLAFPFNV